MTKIDINLVIWNGKKYLPFCIESILKQSFSDWQLNILDNGSTDDSVKYLREHYPNLKVVVLKENIGFAKGHNKLLSWTNSDYVLCLNQDVILDKDFLKNSFDFLNNKKNIGSLSPKIYHWDFKKLNIGDTVEPERARELLNTEKTNIIDTCGLKILKNHQIIDIGQGEKDKEEFQKQKEIFGVSGACPIYNRKALEKIKMNNLPRQLPKSDWGEYFDEDFFSYKEDVDLAYRLKLAGYKSYFLPQTIAFHDRSIKKGNSIMKNRKVKSAWVNQHSYKNHLFCIIKNEFGKNLMKYFFPTFWYEFKKLIYLLFFEKQTFKFFLHNKKQIKKMLKKRKYIFKKIVRIKPEDLEKYYN
jgi:GT2 family glycosyltransferase